MKYLLIAVGTRGDIEPFLAVGEILLKRGHEVTGVFPAQFEYISKEAGLNFIGLTKEFLEMIEGEVGKQALGGKGNFFQKFKSYYLLYKASKKVNIKIFQKQLEAINQVQPDKIIHSLKATIPIYWGMSRPKKSILLSPIPCVIHPMKGYASIAFRGKDFGEWGNRLTIRFTNYALVKNLMSFLKKLGIDQKPDYGTLKKALLKEAIIFTVSPNLLNQQGSPEHVKFVGYLERNKERNWQPTEQILSFTQRHSKFLFLTFGSMSNPEPEKKTEAILSVCKSLEIPVLVNTAAGGLVELESFKNEDCLFVSDIPYDWVLPKAYAIIHHGGSGTTHLGIKYACPTMIIPHIIDQFFWNQVFYDLGLGPKGIKTGSITQKNLTPKIQDLWENQSYLEKAETIAKSMSQEAFFNTMISELER